MKDRCDNVFTEERRNVSVAYVEWSDDVKQMTKVWFLTAPLFRQHVKQVVIDLVGGVVAKQVSRVRIFPGQ